jgi:hypothetical protein
LVYIRISKKTNIATNCQKSGGILPTWWTYLKILSKLVFHPKEIVIGAALALCKLVMYKSLGIPYKYLLSNATYFVGSDSQDEINRNIEDLNRVYCSPYVDEDQNNIDNTTTSSSIQQPDIDRYIIDGNSSQPQTVWRSKYWPKKVMKDHLHSSVVFTRCKIYQESYL